MRQAYELDEKHIGHRIHYGPGLMFDGVLVDLEHMEDDWHQGDDALPFTSPPRVFVMTRDGRTATLAHEAPIIIEGENT